jgi:small ligand-binding sensory domain FIST
MSETTPPPPTFYDSNKQVALQVDLVNGNFPLPDATKAYMKAATAICERAARELTGEASRGVVLDGGQMNAAMQLVQALKDKVCVAAILGAESKRRAEESAASEPAAKRAK